MKLKIKIIGVLIVIFSSISILYNSGIVIEYNNDTEKKRTINPKKGWHEYNFKVDKEAIKKAREEKKARDKNDQ